MGSEVPLSGAEPSLSRQQRLRVVPSEDLHSRLWWSDPGWRRGRLGLFSLFAVAPFVLLRLTADDRDIQGTAWGFAIYFALLWFVALHALIQPGRLNWWMLARVAILTAVAGTAVAIFLEERLVPRHADWLHTVIGVGLPEEFAKALAVFLFVYRSRTPRSTRVYLFVGAVSGLAFGAAEGVSYTQTYADFAAYLTPASYTAMITWRLVSDSLMHATLAAISAYFMGLAYHRARARWLLIGVGLAVPALLHGTYNAFTPGWAGTAMAAVIVLAFTACVRYGDQVAAHLAETPVRTRLSTPPITELVKGLRPARRQAAISCGACFAQVPAGRYCGACGTAIPETTGERDLGGPSAIAVPDGSPPAPANAGNAQRAATVEQQTNEKTRRDRSTPEWVYIPGRGLRYWDGIEYREQEPSSSASASTPPQRTHDSPPHFRHASVPGKTLWLASQRLASRWRL